MASWDQPPREKSSARLAARVILGLLGLGLALLLALRLARSVSPNPKLPEDSELVEVSTGTIGAGGSLGRALNLSRVNSPDSVAIEQALKPFVNARQSRPSDRYEVSLSSEGVVQRFRYWPDPLHYVELNRRTDGVLVAQRKAIPLNESIIGAAGTVQNSLWESMTRQQIPPEVIYQFADIFSWRFDFLTETRQGDEFKVAWRRLKGVDALHDAEIVAAYYKSRDRGDLYAFPVGQDYYDVEGDSLRGEFLRAPLAFRRISSRFTNRRFHPILRYYRPHHGIDYSAAAGTAVQSIAQGVVVEKGYKSGLGNELRVRHAGSYVSIYGHLMSFARNIRIGSHVRQGQTIGYVGSTGLSTGPHLHFGFEQGGRLINFLAMKAKVNPRKVPDSAREAFTRSKTSGTTFLNQLSSATGGLQALRKGS